ncbi:hypothetical protein [Brevibacillus brevis]|uniref:hypothetical protein n=1 Tax=Brevibacillus brevis TaxID=1393 RepID=UPI000D0EE9C1|nr:hypothetical protein [Brevibacillus brevis]PSJ63495.1 hypothetical protein C7J99_31515 [Brevibacillus brevis]RED21255.1 hypothetical protein DES34_12293 [Brevibacillus brevis]VEF87612.1 Uncharacterised protein [Brevibacillus brevis]VEF90156.1 Uncharacterised protein [Brevibacillus brevis]GEC93803.1 hypothetical protein BBR01nite_61340 [Brevibacillus brevis]
MSVKLYVSEGSKRVELELSKANNLQVLNIIQGMFGFLGYELKEITKPIQQSMSYGPIFSDPGAPNKEEPIVESKGIPIPFVPFEMPEASEEVDKQVKGLRQLPLINGGHTLSQSLGEKLGPLLGLEVKEGAAWVDGSENPIVPKESQSHMTIPLEESLIDPTKEYPAIRNINGVPHYQTYVYCKNQKCQKRKKVFVKELQLSVYCPECNTKHVRRDATNGGFPEQDDFGNYFKADRLWVENHKPHHERIKSPLK